MQNIQVIDLTNSNVLDKKMIVKLDKPIHSFPCRCCGKTVEIFDTFDKRTVFCSVQCEKKYWRDATRHKDHGRGGNIGMSGAMSLDSLERYEKRSVDDDKPSIILIKSCAVCGKTFKAKSIRQKFCSRKCNRESYYETEAPKITPPKNTKPIRSFICKVCGKEVDIYEKKDQRHTYCSGKCYKRWKNVLRPQKQQRKQNRSRTDTQGMSKGMSLGSLIKREKRSLE